MIEINSLNKNILSKYKFIDLFAGIGGFHLALGSFGAKCVFASEWDVNASNTYFENLGIMPHGDITKINESEIPSHDILCGGFPCQAFSISGKQKGFEDIRGTLFFEIVRIVNSHKPKVVFLENVKNIIKHNDGNTFKVIVDTLKSLGYNVFTKVLNASDFGVPQNRERIYIVAFNEKLDSSSFKFPMPTNQNICLNDILENDPKDAKIIERDDIVIYGNNKLLAPLFSINEEKINRPIQIGKVNKGGQGERIYHTNGHSITLSAYGGGAGAKTGLYYINNKVRKLSPRECARAQGFPDTFKLNKLASQSYKQFGNSVSINVLQYIAIQIEKILNKN